MRILISWVGNADLDGVNKPDSPGPLIRIAKHEQYDQIHLLCNQPEKSIEPLKAELARVSGCLVELHPVELTSPIHFGDIYQALDSLLSGLSKQHRNPQFTIQLTSGTPAMTAVSILVGKTKYSARFVQASKEQGVQLEDIPFDIAADFLPSIAKKQDQRLDVTANVKLTH